MKKHEVVLARTHGSTLPAVQVTGGSVSKLWMVMLVLAASCSAQQLLYSNGDDNGTGAWAINNGYMVTNSFVLDRPAHLTSVVLSIWDADHLNYPVRVSWRITSEPFGQPVLQGEGRTNFSLLQSCEYVRYFLYCRWLEQVNLNVLLPAGTYWLEMERLDTRFNSWGFWAQSQGPSQAYQTLAPQVTQPARLSPIPSEAFELYGDVP